MITTVATVASLASLSLAATYTKSASHVGTSFLDGFDVMAIPDPTNGRVNYVDAATAASANLTYSSEDTFVLRSDATAVLDAAGAGRDSVRLEGKIDYDNAVMVFDIRHMPQGCGTWPAVWTFGDAWPDNGEVDILEGVNDISPNKATLHTGADCTMPADRAMTGVSVEDNCDVNTDGNAGCGVNLSEANSYGPDFNSNGGGFHAMERTDEVINVWFWPRGSEGIPEGITAPGDSVDTGNWGTPSATFPNTSCDLATKFGPNRITINLTFCGDWAGLDDIYTGAGCPSTCVDYVNNNPEAFADAYFDIAGIYIYE